MPTPPHAVRMAARIFVERHGRVPDPDSDEDVRAVSGYLAAYQRTEAALLAGVQADELEPAGVDSDGDILFRKKEG